MVTDYEKNSLMETEQRSKLNEIQLTEIKDDIKEIKEENKALYTLATSIELMARDMTSVKDSVNEVKKDVSEVKGKMVEIEHAPNKKTADTWDKVKVAIITAVGSMLATGAVAFLITSLASK